MGLIVGKVIMKLNMSDFTQDQLKKRSSYLGKIPSHDFDAEQYDIFLSYASTEELEQDILKRETLHKIMSYFGWN